MHSISIPMTHCASAPRQVLPLAPFALAAALLAAFPLAAAARADAPMLHTVVVSAARFDSDPAST